METYCIVLGREAELGLAELRMLLSVNDPAATTSTVAPGVVLVQPTVAFDPAAWMDRLGGSRFIARMHHERAHEITAASLNSLLPPTVREVAIASPSLTPDDRTKLLQGLKKLRPGLRYRLNNDAYLASGLSERLIRRDDGAEILIIRNQDASFLVGQVVAVQDAHAWTDRDRNLPAIDAVAGMLPPKLARIMVNLAEPARPSGRAGILLDPFSGSGRIPIEALRLGWQVQASDIETQAIERTDDNLDWAIGHYSLDLAALLDITERDIRAVAAEVTPQSIDAIVAEPDLGPALRANTALPSPVILDRVANTVAATFAAGRTVLRPGGRLVFVIPIIGNVRIADRLDDSVRDGYTFQESFTYARPDARVEREIVVYDRKG